MGPAAGSAITEGSRCPCRLVKELKSEVRNLRSKLIKQRNNRFSAANRGAGRPDRELTSTLQMSPRYTKS
jgi:hypothetical protein